MFGADIEELSDESELESGSANKPPKSYSRGITPTAYNRTSFNVVRMKKRNWDVESSPISKPFRLIGSMPKPSAMAEVRCMS